MLILKGEVIDQSIGSYVASNGETVKYRDVMLRVAPMVFEKVRVPFDYPVKVGADKSITFQDDDKFHFGANARRYNNVTKKFEYTPINYFMVAKKFD
jgi:hypothetical protein